MQSECSKSGLRYIEASRVVDQAGERAPVEVRGEDDRKIGSLDGVLVDPVQRRVRFVVVKSPTSRRYLLPTECPARVDTSCQSLRVDLDSAELAECEEFEPSAVRQFSDDDLLGAMFGRRIA